MPNTSGEAIYFTDVAFPVKNSQNDVLGVLCTHLSWQWTRDIIRSIEKNNSVDIFLLANDGLILVGPENSERKQLSEISPNAAKEFLETSTEYKTISWKEGADYLTAHAISEGFEEYKGFGWNVIVRQPVVDAFKDAKSNSNAIFLISIIAAFIGGLIGIILSNMITSPLKKLHKEVIEFKDNGKLNISKVTKGDEISDLQNALVDLNESLNKESALKKDAEDKVRIAIKVFDQSLEGILITDENNNIVLVNEAFTKITGYTQNEVYLKNPSILSTGEYPKSFYTRMWDELITNGKWEGHINNKRKDDVVYSEHLKISTLKDSDGNIINYFATFNSGF